MPVPRVSLVALWCMTLWQFERHQRSQIGGDFPQSISNQYNLRSR